MNGDRMSCGAQPDHMFLSISEVCRMGIDLCTALDLCERNRIIHRDIKPANLFRDRYGNYKVGDFGIARQVDAFGARYQSAAEFRKALCDYLYAMNYEDDMLIVQSENAGGAAGNWGYAQAGETTQYSFKTRISSAECLHGISAFSVC